MSSGKILYSLLLCFQQAAGRTHYKINTWGTPWGLKYLQVTILALARVFQIQHGSTVSAHQTVKQNLSYAYFHLLGCHHKTSWTSSLKNKRNVLITVTDDWKPRSRCQYSSILLRAHFLLDASAHG